MYLYIYIYIFHKLATVPFKAPIFSDRYRLGDLDYQIDSSNRDILEMV